MIMACSFKDFWLHLSFHWKDLGQINETGGVMNRSMKRQLSAMIVLGVCELIFAGGLAGQTSQTLSISVAVDYEEANQGSIALKAGEDSEPIAKAELPAAFLAGDLTEVVFLVPTDDRRTLSADRLYLRHSDSLATPLSAPVALTTVEDLRVEYHPDSRDLPGTYHGRLATRGLEKNRIMDLVVDVAPFVAYELRRNRLGRDLEGHATGQLEILVTSNARRWTLTYRLVTPPGTSACGDLKLAADRGTGSWEVSHQGQTGTISGRGPVQDHLLRLIPQAGIDGGACDAIVEIESVTAR